MIRNCLLCLEQTEYCNNTELVYTKKLAASPTSKLIDWGAPSAFWLNQFHKQSMRFFVLRLLGPFNCIYYLLLFYLFIFYFLCLMMCIFLHLFFTRSLSFRERHCINFEMCVGYRVPEGGAVEQGNPGVTHVMNSIDLIFFPFSVYNFLSLY